MSKLLTVTALFEAATGLALLIAPSPVVAVLLGARLESPAATTVARVAGAALLSLGIACGLARHDGTSRAARGLVMAMLLYNVAVAALIVQVRLAAGLFGIAFWPVLLAHGALAAWCLSCLRQRPDEREA